MATHHVRQHGWPAHRTLHRRRRRRPARSDRASSSATRRPGCGRRHCTVHCPYGSAVSTRPRVVRAGRAGTCVSPVAQSASGSPLGVECSTTTWAPTTGRPSESTTVISTILQADARCRCRAGDRIERVDLVRRSSKGRDRRPSTDRPRAGKPSRNGNRPVIVRGDPVPLKTLMPLGRICGLYTVTGRSAARRVREVALQRHVVRRRPGRSRRRRPSRRRPSPPRPARASRPAGGRPSPPCRASTV